MLLTISTSHTPATDLGYLLHKNPAKLHSFELSFGKAHVFYPEATTEELTAAGGGGMVVKPLEFVTKGRKGLAQPAANVRGREYLRIIYGPEYTLPENL